MIVTRAQMQKEPVELLESKVDCVPEKNLGKSNKKNIRKGRSRTDLQKDNNGDE